MTYKHIALFYFSTVQLFLYTAIFVLGVSLLLGGPAGMMMALPAVSIWVGIPLLVLVFVPIVATLLITGCALLAERLFGVGQDLVEGCWLRCAGCTLAVVCCIGGVAEVYAWVLRPLMHWS